MIGIETLSYFINKSDKLFVQNFSKNDIKK